MGRVEARSDQPEGTDITFYEVLKRYVEAGKTQGFPLAERPPQLKTPRQRTDTARCPYCYALLAEAPTRKKKCPFCGSIICPRVQPGGRGHVLTTSEQLRKEALESRYRKQLGRMTRGRGAKAALSLRGPGPLPEEKTREEIIARLEKYREKLQIELESIEACAWWFPKALHNRWKQLKVELKSMDEHITELKKRAESDETVDILSEENRPHSWF